MSTVLQQESSAPSAPVQLEQTNGLSGNCAQQQNNEKDILYWQRSLEVLSQKVIVGCTVDANNKKQTLLTQEIEQDSISSQDSVPTGICSVDKDYLSEGEYAACEHGLYDENAEVTEHDSNLFRLNCCCEACLNHRETIIQLFVEDFEYNTLWERLQLLIKKFYDFIPEDKDSQLYCRYMELMDKTSLKWLTDGRINTKKNIQISLGSNLPLSNEMTFILVFSMLYTRDPHQLFELLCLQLRSIVKAYSKGLQDLITKTSDGKLKYSPTDLVTYILDGYDRLLHSAKGLAPLLFELQRGHLQTLQLSWPLINKRMYQRFVYLEVQKIIPECILKLKDMFSEEDYKTIVCRFIEFDNEMNATSQIWCNIWNLLHDYHKSREDSARRKRIHSAHLLLVAVRDSEFNFDADVLQRREHPIVGWPLLEDRRLVWQYALHNLKTKWTVCSNPRLTAPIVNIQCRKCNYALAAHYVECICRTCIIAGGTYPEESKDEMFCAKCSFFKTLDRHCTDYIGDFFNKPSDEKTWKKRINGMLMSSQSSSSRSTMEITLAESSATGGSGSSYTITLKGGTTPTPNVEVTSRTTTDNNTVLYHISWAIFKHMPERVVYTWTTLEPSRFCIFQVEPCKMNACRVAINIIAMLYPLNLSKFLIKSYHPLKETERRKMAENWNIDVKKFMQKFCDDINKRWRSEIADQIHPLHFLDLLWESDDAESALLGDMASAFAEWFLMDFQFPQRNVIYQYFIKFFLAKGYDIEFDMKCFECLCCSRLFNWCTPASPLRQMIADDMQNKLLGVNWSSILSDEALAAINGANLSSARLDSMSGGNSICMPTADATDSTNEPISMLDAVFDPIVKVPANDGSICRECKTSFVDENTKLDIFEKDIMKPATEAIRLTASNRVLESELQNLQKEHSMLKDMVRDLEQIHEQKHSCSANQSQHNGTSSSNSSSGNSGTIENSNATSSTNKSSSVSVNNNNVKNFSKDNIASKSAVSQSGSAIVPPSMSASPAVKKTVMTVMNSPTKTMLNQATNTPPETVAHLQPSNAKLLPPGTSLSQTAKGVMKAAHSLMGTSPIKTPPSPATPAPALSKVSSKATSMHPSPGGVSAAPTVSPSTSMSSSGTASSTSPHAIQCKEEHKKACHRGANGGEKGDGSCVCYYCTLFGQSVCLECNHNQRTNETRDRLRKKIKQLQSNKDTQQLKSLNLKNIKIPPGGLLKKINTNKSNSTNAVATSNVSVPSNATKGAAHSKTEVQQKNSNLKTASSATNLPTAAAATTKIPMVTTPPSSKPLLTGVTTKVNGTALRKEASQPLSTAQQISKVNTNSIPQVKKPPPPSAPVEEQSLDDILKFIEGNDSKQANNKKISKKIKQKQKKQELKKITELGELRQKFSEFQLEEQNAQKRLQFLQHLNKKDRNQLQEQMKTYEERKIQLQTDINKIVSNIRSNNPDFTFKLDTSSSKPVADPVKDSSTKAKPTRQSTPSNEAQLKTSPIVQQNVNMQLPQKHIQKQLLEQQKTLQRRTPQQPSPVLVPQDNVSIDPARRMVTIKRTFLPHSEPQVTVTAKGSSPDKDQLLYTFVNGQLVPPDQHSIPINGAVPSSASSAQQTRKEASATLQQDFKQLEQFRMKRMFSDACDLLMKNEVTPASSDVMIAEKLLKLSFRDQPQPYQVQTVREIDELIEKLQRVNGRLEKKTKDNILSLISRLTGKLAQIRNKPVNTFSKTQSNAAMQILQKMTNKLELEDDPPCGEGKKKKKKKKNTLADEINEIDEIVAKLDGLDVNGGSKKGTDNKSLTKILNRKMSKDSISSNGSVHKTKEEKENKSREKTKHDSGKERADKSSVREQEVKKKVVRRKNDGYIDPEFDNNTFKLLKADDSESEVEEDIAVEAEEEVPIVVKNEILKPEKIPSRPPTPVSPKANDSALLQNQPNQASVMVATNKKHNKKKNEKTKDSVIPLAIVCKDSKQVKNKENVAPASIPIVQKNSKNENSNVNINNKKSSPVGTQLSILESSNSSKRQRKQRKQDQAKPTQPLMKQQQLQQKSPVSNRRFEKTTNNADKIFKVNDRNMKDKELTDESNALSVASKTGACPKIPNTFSPGDNSFGTSLVDQLSRGIRVEGLQLPPGITLTRVDPAHADELNAKRESIKNICEPMRTVHQEQPAFPSQLMHPNVVGPGMMVMNPLRGQPAISTVPGQESVIMVDTNQLNGRSGECDKKTARKNKRKNKNKSKHDSTSEGDKNQKNNIVTLRNPMFQGAGTARVPSTGDPVSKKVPLGRDQPAAIFRNDNGMFTIRNPLLHQSIGGEETPSTSGFKPFNNDYLAKNGIYPESSKVTSNAAAASYSQTKRQTLPVKDSSFGSDVSSPNNSVPFCPTGTTSRKCNSVIGSEMKNAQKQKQKQLQHHQPQNQHRNPWQQMNGQSATANDMYSPLAMSEQTATQRSYSPFESLHGLSGSQDYADPQSPSNSLYPHTLPMNAIGSERSQARAHAVASMSASANPSCRQLFSVNGPPVGSSSSPHFSNNSPSGTFYDELGASPISSNPKYDDLSFLRNLQPGQRLNSEVTIHNINESKFHRQQGQKLSNDIEIKRVTEPGGSVSSGFSHSSQTTRPLLMSPAGSTISGETAAVATSSSITGGGVAIANSTAPTPSANLLSDIDSHYFLQKYQQQQLQLQHQLQQQMQQLRLHPISQQQQQQLIGEYGENIFAPNQMVNLNELESEEREIESFKRFDYYFDPPKNKPKINLNVKDIVVNSKKSAGAAGNNCNEGSSSSSSISNDNNPGGVSIGEDIQPIRPQAPIGTPSQRHFRQQQGTPVSSVGTGASTMIYPATSDSPVSSVSFLDGVSSSMSSQAHSCDDLYNDLLTSSGNLSLNVNLSFSQLHHSNSDPVAYGSAVGGGAPSLASAGSSSSGGDRKPSTNETTHDGVSN